MNKPTIKQLFEYSNNMEQSTLFFHHFESQGWKVGKNPMKNWKSALTGWIKRSKPKESKVEIALSSAGETIIEKLWRRMTEIYGHKWVSSYGTKPSEPWVDLFNRMEPLKIKHGLTELLNEGDDWPPSLVKFNGLCKSYREPIKALSHLPGPKEIMAQRERTADIRLNEMNKIREMI